METRPINPPDPDYPDRLADLVALGASWNPLPPLHVRGTMPDPARRGVCIIGSRQCTDHARAFTRDIARQVAAAGHVVWSGGALGIDGAAHEGALDAGGTTGVVMAGSLAHPYPKAHRGLFDRVLAGGGATMSLWPDGTRRQQWQFLRRNAVLAAVSDVVVVIEARAKGGATRAARVARRLGRRLLVAPAAPWETKGAGCAELLADGASPLGSVRDVLALAEAPRHPPPRPWRPSPRPRQEPPGELDADGAALLAELDDEPRHVDGLVLRLSWSFSRVQRASLSLQLRGDALEGPPMHLRRR